MAERLRRSTLDREIGGSSPADIRFLRVDPGLNHSSSVYLCMCVRALGGYLGTTTTRDNKEVYISADKK